MDEGRLGARCLSKEKRLDEDGVLPNVNLPCVGSPPANGLDNRGRDLIFREGCGTAGS